MVLQYVLNKRHDLNMSKKKVVEVRLMKDTQIFWGMLNYYRELLKIWTHSVILYDSCFSSLMWMLQVYFGLSQKLVNYVILIDLKLRINVK